MVHTLEKSQTNDEDLKNRHFIDVLQHEHTYFSLLGQNVSRLHYAYTNNMHCRKVFQVSQQNSI